MITVPLIIMGVSGAGKSRIGELLARALQLPFIDGDSLQPSANKAKMAAGVPLNDQDRAPWLDAVGAQLAEGPKVIACSALKRRYRDALRAAVPGVRFIYLSGSRELLAQRLAGRSHEYMPASLLDSQLADLEVPASSENALTVTIDQTPQQIVQACLAALEALRVSG